ncbi:unnamed protein product [Moneuplotes crassus]|uniref:Phosphodiesterase n=1 Tax=Euplotes crassus TaxID=5936 RepID=A0AAD1X332_EUPCR|nr:unnamed protein product [Moneuplotes crassus]
MNIVVKEPPAEEETSKHNEGSDTKNTAQEKEETKESSPQESSEEDSDSQRNIWKVIAVVSVLFYFVYRHIWKNENQFPKVLVLSIGVEITLIMMVVYPKWKSNDLQKVFGDSSVQLMMVTLLITMVFDLCGIFQIVFGGVNVLILLARISRVALYYVLLTNFESEKAEQKRQKIRDEIDRIKNQSDLNSILQTLEEKCENKDEVIKASIEKGIEVHKESLRKKKARNGLLKASFMRDDTDTDPMKINEVKLSDVNDIVEAIDSNPEKFFYEDFDFITMEDQYDLKMVLDSSQDLEFDVFDLQAKSENNELYVFGMYIMTKDSYLEEFRIDKKKLQNFLYAIQESYNPVAYHNKTHATDLSQTLYYFLENCDVKEVCNLSRMEEMSMLLAGFMHDLNHPGYTNSFLINTSSPLALRYNDKSVLENYHVAMGFKIMKGSEQCDIFDRLSMRQNREIRKFMVDLILATDMANHFNKMFALEQRVAQDDFDTSGIDKELCTEFIFHISDISNTSKPWPVCKKWIDKLFIEFFNQGDKEKEIGLEISYLMDRKTINVAESQDGFIKNMIKPAFEILDKFLPNLSQNITNLDDNVEKWKKKVPQYAIEKHSHKETKKLAGEGSKKSRSSIRGDMGMIIEAENEHDESHGESKRKKSAKKGNQEKSKEEMEYLSEDSYVPSEYTPYLSARRMTSSKEFGIYQIPKLMETLTKKQMSEVVERKAK